MAYSIVANITEYRSRSDTGGVTFAKSVSEAQRERALPEYPATVYGNHTDPEREKEGFLGARTGSVVKQWWAKRALVEQGRAQERGRDESGTRVAGVFLRETSARHTF